MQLGFTWRWPTLAPKRSLYRFKGLSGFYVHLSSSWPHALIQSTDLTRSLRGAKISSRRFGSRQCHVFSCCGVRDSSVCETEEVRGFRHPRWACWREAACNYYSLDSHQADSSITAVSLGARSRTKVDQIRCLGSMLLSLAFAQAKVAHLSLDMPRWSWLESCYVPNFELLRCDFYSTTISHLLLLKRVDSPYYQASSSFASDFCDSSVVRS